MAEKRTRSKQIVIRMTDEEYLQFQNRLYQTNLKQNDFIRKCILTTKINVISDLTELVKVLKPIGNNLNQIAKSKHINDDIQMTNTTQKLQEGVNQLWQLLKRLMVESR